MMDHEAEIREKLELANRLADEKRYQEAIEILQELIRLDPANADLLSDLGTLYGEAGDEALEEQTYRQALQREPDHATALYNLGMLYERQARWPEAIHCLENCFLVTTSHEERSEAVQAISQIKSRNPGLFPPVPWVEAARTHGQAAAEMMAERLRGQGIKALAWQGGAGNAMGLSVGSLGTSRVMVPESDLAAAQAILETADEVEVTCPHCGVELVLDDEEVEQGWYDCPDCGRRHRF